MPRGHYLNKLRLGLQSNAIYQVEEADPRSSGEDFSIYSRTSMTRILMACLPQPFRTHS